MSNTKTLPTLEEVGIGTALAAVAWDLSSCANASDHPVKVTQGSWSWLATFHQSDQ